MMMMMKMLKMMDIGKKIKDILCQVKDFQHQSW